MDNDQSEIIRQNIEVVLERIQNSAKTSGRDPKNITLVAVTKQKPAFIVRTLFDFGIKKIAESYLKEASLR